MNIYLLTHEVTIKILCMHFILAFLHFCSLFFFFLYGFLSVCVVGFLLDLFSTCLICYASLQAIKNYAKAVDLNWNSPQVSTVI